MSPPRIRSLFCRTSIFRLSVVTLLVGFASLSLIGCRSDDADLVVLTIGGWTRLAVEAAVEEFEQEHPGVRVRVVSTPGKDYYVKSLTMLAGRAHVDVLWLGQGFGIFAGRGALLDLGTLIGRDTEFDLSIYNSQVVDWYRRGDALYGIPYGVDVQAIAYNQELFDAAGLPYPKPDWTVEEMIATAKELSQFDPNSGRMKVAGVGMNGLDYRYYGLDLLSEDHQRFALNTDVGREWLRRNVDLVRARILQKGGELESMDRLAGFLNGRVAMIEAATWDIPELRDRAPFRWDVVRLPIGRTGMRIGWASSSGFSIARNTKHPELAWALLKKLGSAKFQERNFANTIPTLNTLHGAYLQAHPAPPEHLPELLKMTNHMLPNPRIAAFQEVQSEFIFWSDQALLEKISPETALREAESHINRILDLEHASR